MVLQKIRGIIQLGFVAIIMLGTINYLVSNITFIHSLYESYNSYHEH